MLLNVLPGLRDLRAPLATGFLWLATVWVIFRDQLDPANSPPDSLIRDIADLEAQLGTGATIAALTFTAYLLGVVLSITRPPRYVDNLLAQVDARRYGREVDLAVDNRHVRKIVKAIRPAGTYGNEGRFGTPYELAWEAIRQLLEGDEILDSLAVGTSEKLPLVVRRRVSEQAEHFPERMGGVAPDDFPYRDASVVARAVAGGTAIEMPALVNRLQIERESIFDRFDRMQAESEFRITCALPLAALMVALGFEWSPWALVGLVLAAVIYLLGIRRHYESQAVIWEAVAQGLIDSDTITSLRAAVAEELKSAQRQPSGSNVLPVAAVASNGPTRRFFGRLLGRAGRTRAARP